MKKERRKTWDVGNIFGVPLSDGSYVIGQVVGREAEALNSITCAFFDIRLHDLEAENVEELIDYNRLISVQFTTPDSLKSRVWKVLGSAPVKLDKKYYPYEETRNQRWVGAVIQGSGIMVHFLEAYYCNQPWDQMYEKDFFDTLLISSDRKPKQLVYKNAL